MAKIPKEKVTATTRKGGGDGKRSRETPGHRQRSEETETEQLKTDKELRRSKRTLTTQKGGGWCIWCGVGCRGEGGQIEDVEDRRRSDGGGRKNG